MSENIFKSLEKAISKECLSTYEEYTKNNLHDALELYIKNARYSSAFTIPL